MKNLNVYMINPRGFCAGVNRALQIVDKSIDKFNISPENPLYIRNEIVHNKNVVNELSEKGVIFTKDVLSIPEGKHAIFSAHGVSEKIEQEAASRNLHYIDATCPLVKKVHKEAIKLNAEGYFLILIGHYNHPEVEGTLGRVKDNIVLVTNTEEANSLEIPEGKEKLAYITQTTLSLDDTVDIVDVLKERFPHIKGLAEQYICYATQNRQNAIKNIVNKIDGLIIIGSQNSSNSNRLKELGSKNNVYSILIDNESEINWEEISKCENIAISAGASAPEKIVQNVLNAIKDKYNTNVIDYEYTQENVVFHIPKELR